MTRTIFPLPRCFRMPMPQYRLQLQFNLCRHPPFHRQFNPHLNHPQFHLCLHCQIDGRLHQQFISRLHHSQFHVSPPLVGPTSPPTARRISPPSHLPPVSPLLVQPVLPPSEESNPEAQPECIAPVEDTPTRSLLTARPHHSPVLPPPMEAVTQLPTPVFTGSHMDDSYPSPVTGTSTSEDEAPTSILRPNLDDLPPAAAAYIRKLEMTLEDRITKLEGLLNSNPKKRNARLCSARIASCPR